MAALVFITGISGSGKSEVLKELRRRGLDAHGTDEDGIAAFFDRTSGAELQNPPAEAAGRTPAWRRKYVWRMKRDRVEQLASMAAEKLIFLCGVAENEGEMWHLFGQVFALTVDSETLKHRIASRTTNNFGKVPHEMEAILRWQEQTGALYEQHGHICIDATRPIGKVVDDILAAVQLATGPGPELVP